MTNNLSVENAISVFADSINSDKGEFSVIEELLDNNDETALLFIRTAHLIIKKHTDGIILKLLDTYHIAGVFQWPCVYKEFTSFSLVYLTKSKPELFIYSVFKKWDYPRISYYNSDHTNQELCEYIQEINTYLANGRITHKISNYEMDILPYSEISSNHFNPKYYLKKSRIIRKKLENDKVIPLGNIAEIISFPIPSYEYVSGNLFAITANDCINHTQISNIIRSESKNCLLLKNGDILLPMLGSSTDNICFFSNETELDYYADSSVMVIRPKSILPEYLYLYLISDSAQDIFESNDVSSLTRTVTFSDISELSIVIPQHDITYYKDIYKSLTQNTRGYVFPICKHEEKTDNSFQEILDTEYIEKIRLYNFELLQTQLTEDLFELNICFENKAYKATLILAGSILEAILIDWLSEIHGVDYFNTDYYVPDRRNPNRQKRADLIDYIDSIETLKRPAWIQEAREAHTIRKKRNLVHAKLAINSEDVNEDTCREVIAYLKDVIISRGVHTPL